MNTKLINLTTQRVNLSISIVVLRDELADLIDAPMDKRLEIVQEIAYNQGLLHEIENNIEIEELNELWTEDNVYIKGDLK
jgi:hypothetical protein